MMKLKLSKRVCKRVLSLFLAVALAVSAVVYRPPKAEAFAAALVIPIVAAAFLAAAGITWVNAGKDNESFTESVNGLLQDYLNVKFGGETITEWAGDIALSSVNGTLYLPKLLAGKLGEFAAWVASTFSLSDVGDVTATPSTSFVFSTFNKNFSTASTITVNSYSLSNPISMQLYSSYANGYWYNLYSSPAFIPSDSGTYHFVVPYNFSMASDGVFKIFVTSNYTATSGSNIYTCYDGNVSRTGVASIDLSLNQGTSYYVITSFYPTGVGSYSCQVQAPYVYYSDPALSLQQSNALDIPDTESMGDDQAVALDTGITADDTDALLQQILDAIVANNLAVTQDVVTPSDSDLTWTDTLWGWLTGIKDAIIGLPARIADAVKALFIPDEAFFGTAVADLQATFQGRMGLLTYPMSVLYNFTDRVLNIQNQEPILRWNAVNFMDHQLIPAGQYNLNDGLQTPALKTAHDIYFIVVNAVMILAFLDLCWKKYREVTHN